MQTITATELARNLRQVLDRLAVEQSEIVIERNHQPVGRLLPGAGRMTALEAMADLYQTLPETAGRDWLSDSRATDLVDVVSEEVRDPWAI
jgi:antitoxin (DNA-binding transcriptional repressor) of toxin-antitoxin stability system